MHWLEGEKAEMMNAPSRGGYALLRLLLLLALVCGHADRPRNTDSEVEPEACGAEGPTEEEQQADAANMQSWRLQGRTYVPPRHYTIPLYFHVIEEENTAQIISEERVQFYVDYLNDAFEDSVFFFEYREYTRTSNTEWASGGRVAEIEYAFKRELKRGGMESLNIYLVNKLPPPEGTTGANWVGFAYYPFSSAAQNGYKDGVVVTSTYPGDERRPNTLVHEVVRFESTIHKRRD